MASEVVLAAAVRSALVAHARRAAPRECCGLLVASRSRIEYAVAVRNVARGTARYRIDPSAHIELRRQLRRFAPALQIAGVYHSHPAGSMEPSATDIAEAYYRNWTYVIVGLSRQIRAFTFRRSHAKELRVRWS